MKKQLILALAIAAMATACTKTPSDTNGDSIMLKGKTLTVDVKSPFEGEISDVNKLTAFVPASLVTGDYGTTYASGNMIFGTAATAVGYEVAGFTGSAVYPADATTNVHLVGLYPATNWGALTTTSALTFVGSEDVMAAPEVVTTKADAPTSYKNLTFNHKLTRLEFSIKATGATAIDAWGNINEITVTKNGANDTFDNIATITLKDASVVFSGAKAGEWPTYEATASTYSDTPFTGKSIALTTTAAKVAYTMLVPVTATDVVNSAEYTISVKATKAGSTQVTVTDIPVDLKASGNASSFAGPTAGYSFNVVLNFTALDIKATATVTPWNLQGDSNVDIK